MKIFLQHKETSLFFQKSDAWSVSYMDALDFGQARKAAEFANHYGIDNVRILVIAATITGGVQMLPFELPAPVQTTETRA
ncbi:MAG: hypothetical protein JWR69_4215 [Pedosphaera sp.]|nr:hypothetical protein [Pedosphaera sp.]